MEIKLHEISVRDVFDGYENNESTGQVVAFGGKLAERASRISKGIRLRRQKEDCRYEFHTTLISTQRNVLVG